MSRFRYPYLLLTAAVVALSLLQRLPLLAFFGIKPNLVLAFFTALGVGGEHFLPYGLLLILSAVLLRPYSYFDGPTLTLVGLLVASFWLAKILPAKALVNLAVLIGVLTVAFYLMVSFNFFTAHPAAIVGEAVVNITVGMAFYQALRRWR